MAELEIHHETESGVDHAGRRVGLLSAALAVFLALVTIASHRTHTAAIMAKTEANDQWEYYQSRRIKLHTLQLGQDLIAALGAKNGATEALLRKYEAERQRYERDGERIQEQGKEKETEARHAEQVALRYDFGEGLLEIGLVLTSLYFISRRRFFPAIGIVAGLSGIAVAAAGLMV